MDESFGGVAELPGVSVERLRVGIVTCPPLPWGVLAIGLSDRGFDVELLGEMAAAAHRRDLDAIVADAGVAADLLGVPDEHSVVLPLVFLGEVPAVAAPQLVGLVGAVLQRTTTLDRLALVLRVVVGGGFVLDEHARSMLARPAPTPPRCDLLLDEDQVTWLRQLAYGSTVTDMAATAHLSRRHMYRRLEALFELLGASNRHAAVSWAFTMGVLTSDAPPGPELVA